MTLEHLQNHTLQENNNQPFEKATRSGRRMRSVNSQDKFYQILTPQRIKELICRFSTGLIASHISSARANNKELDSAIEVKSEWKSKTKSLYVDYFYNNQKIYHFSIHLYPRVLNSRTNGPMHFKINSENNTKIISYPFMVRGSACGSECVVFNIKNSQYIDKSYADEIAILRAVINAYFDKRHAYYIDKPLCVGKSMSMCAAQRIHTNIRNILSRDVHTRRLPRSRF